jgi:hypothetical protein
MSRLPTLPGRVPAAAARLSRPEDRRSVAGALYDESLGDDAGSMLCELLDLRAKGAAAGVLCGVCMTDFNYCLTDTLRQTSKYLKITLR